MVMASPSVGADNPYLSLDYETTIPNMFIVGELGGLALIKNAVNQGRDCVDTIAARFNGNGAISGVFDVLIIGAGPAGISASLRAIENKLSYLTVERDEVGGTVAKYPRQKLVMTSPVEFPMLGKAGEPRKLGVKGEELPKVMYRLIEADHYINKKILVVGGGDSAVEAAMGLASQAGNQVTLSYRSERFSRIKERNEKRMQDFMRTGKVKVLFNSNPVEFKPESVIIEVKGGATQEIPNDFVWIFAGGQDFTLEASKAAKQADAERKQFADMGAAAR